MVSSVTDTTIPAAAAGIDDIDAARLTLRGLVKRYSADPSVAPAVESIDLDIEPGEFITLLGPSGCGKTSTLRMIAGFETLTEGAIELDGVDIAGMPPNRRPMSMVFQSYALFPHLSVRDNVSYGLKLKRMSARRIVEDVDGILAIMNLSGLADRAPHQLSGGQQQRVALARAITTKPKVLLLDEPLSNLDARLRLEARSFLKELQRELGVTSVFVTHDQSEALALADRMAVMKDGRIQQIGTPREVFHEPANTFVASFIGSHPMNLIEGEVFDGALQVLGTRLQVPGATRDQLREGQRIVCGFRPEYVTWLPEPAPGAVEAHVATVENLGAAALITARADGQKFQAVVPEEPLPEEEQRCWFGIPVSKTMAFDATSGERIGEGER